MKSTLIVIFLLSGLQNIYGQPKNEDSLRGIVGRHKGDKAEVDALAYLGVQARQGELSNKYAQQGLTLARKINYRKGEADCLLVFEKNYSRQGNFSSAIQYAHDALTIYEDLEDPVGIATAHAMIQAIYREAGDYRKSLTHAFITLQIAEKHNVQGSFIFPGQRWHPLILAEIAQTYILLNQLDSALFYTQKSIALKELFKGTEWGFPVYLLATIQSLKGSYRDALEKYRAALVLSVQNGLASDTLQIFSGMSTLFKLTGQLDSAVHYGQIVVHGWRQGSEYKNLVEAVSNLAHVYKSSGNRDSASKYTELKYAIKDSIFSAEKAREVQRVAFNAKLKEEEIKAAEIRYKSNLQLYVLIAGVLVLLLISSILWYSNNQKQKAKSKIEKAYSELKIAQAQLVQSEKMASLGELTAGIAHEIQNPLNFVNNFSDINTELIDELKSNLNSGNNTEAFSLADDIKKNEQKINQHGKRADAIVKGMLQHSRASSGKKEPTDINALADEYLRLSYHGLRAKDKNFNANFKTDFDESLLQVEMVPQDIGRVLLNLYNNAFYSVHAKAKQAGEAYKPEVTVITAKKDMHVLVIVRDNGNGIPQRVLEKIFQPFFTTKPTGQGTGLGLSISYDIINAHGGELKVETEEGEGSAFTIQLPSR